MVGGHLHLPSGMEQMNRGEHDPPEPVLANSRWAGIGPRPGLVASEGLMGRGGRI